MKCKTTFVLLPSECRNSHQHNNPRYAVTELIRKKKTQFLQKDKAYIDHRWTILLNPTPEPEINALMSKTDQAETYLLPCADCLHLRAPHSNCRRKIGAAQSCGLRVGLWVPRAHPGRPWAALTVHLVRVGSLSCCRAAEAGAIAEKSALSWRVAQAVLCLDAFKAQGEPRAKRECLAYNDVKKKASVGINQFSAGF